MSDDDGPALSAHTGGSVSGQVVVGSNNNVFENVVVAVQGSAALTRLEPPPAVQPRSRPVGSILPRAGARLVGRDGELEQVTRWLNAGVPVQVHGESGVGKSALLRRIAIDRAAAGADVLFLPVTGSTVDDLVQTLFQACYDFEDYRPEPIRLRRLMGSIEALIVLDDFHGSAADLGMLLDLVTAGDVLVSSAEHTLIGVGRDLALRGLGADAAVSLIEHELGRPLGAEETAAVREVHRAVDGNPRALLQAAASLRLTGALPRPTDPEGTAHALVSGLSRDARDAMDLLWLLDGLVLPPEVLSATTGIPNAEATLHELERRRLAESVGRGYVLACPPETWRWERSGPPPDAADHAAPLAGWASAAPPRDVADCAPLVLRVLAAAVRSGRHTDARDLARAAAPALAGTLRWGSWQQVLALGRQSALALGAAADVAYFEHEETVRRKALGLTPDTAPGASDTAPGASDTAPGASGMGTGTDVTVSAHRGPKDGSTRVRGRGLRAFARRPLVLASAAVVAVTGGVAVTIFAGAREEGVGGAPESAVPANEVLVHERARPRDCAKGRISLGGTRLETTRTWRDSRRYLDLRAVVPDGLAGTKRVWVTCDSGRYAVGRLTLPPTERLSVFTHRTAPRPEPVPTATTRAPVPAPEHPTGSEDPTGPDAPPNPDSPPNPDAPPS